MKNIFVIALTALLGVAIAAGAKAPKEKSVKPSAKSATVAEDYRQIPFNTIDGQPTNLSAFKGTVVLVVNVASKCGFTPQYQGLEQLYEKYKDQGLVVIGFPANNFKSQEPGTNQEIQKFCTTNYGVTFPMMSKISVNGSDMHPLYAYLTEKSSIPGPIKWNFSKFLLDRDGNLVARWPSQVEPMSTDITSQIEKLLKVKAAM